MKNAAEQALSHSDVEPVLTKDGSYTLYHKTYRQSYHSGHGAISESMHVFVQPAFENCKSDIIHVLEVGFGTGLNAWLMSVESLQLKRNVRYMSLEVAPVQPGLYLAPNSHELATEENSALWTAIESATWDFEVQIHPYFYLHKRLRPVHRPIPGDYFDIIFYDAFSPQAQPELWTSEIFSHVFTALKPGGFLTTYCAQSQMRKNMRDAGFEVFKLPGAPGKREMTLAKKH